MIKSAKYYTDFASKSGWADDSHLDKERILLLKKFIKGKSILDIGCGTGAYVDYLSLLGFNVTGVDFVNQFIEKAKKTKKGNFIKAKADSLPFVEKQFDTTFLFDILEHGDDKKILAEAKRVTKKRILVIVPKTVDSKLEQSGVIFRHYLDKSHQREYTEKGIQGLAKDAGLRLKLIKSVHPLYNETIFLSLFRAPQILIKIVRKLVFLILPKTIYHTEVFAVFDK